MSDEKVKMERYAVVDAILIDRLKELCDAIESLTYDAKGEWEKFYYSRRMLFLMLERIIFGPISNAVRDYPADLISRLTSSDKQQQEGGGK